MQFTYSNPLAQSMFSALFTYEGNDLGVTYHPSETAFRLWSPTAYHAYVRLYTCGAVSEQERPIHVLTMSKSENGTWLAKYDGDCKGLFYNFVVNVAGEEREAVDPYAKAVGVNGERGQVIDMKDTNPKGWDSDIRPFNGCNTDAVVYEAHVRDLSVSQSSGIKNKGLFLGVAEEDTACPSGEKTGLAHIKELGVTHIQLLPIYDYHTIDESMPHAHQYNWGYDPKNYNVPEGSLSTDPYRGEVRIRECKQMIKALHDNGIGCVMDVVYNHTYKTHDSHLNMLTPEYYYRQNGDGVFTNGSGCGNEIASERSMVRKMIVDSVIYWAKEYHIDGFRFDLMGLIDTETMNEIRAKLDEIDTSILTYGEGWTGGDSALPDSMKSTKYNIKKLSERIGVFSDDFRDTVKGSVFDNAEQGFINGNARYKDSSLRRCIIASLSHPELQGEGFASAPTQIVSYMSAHDNLTLWDKLKETNPNDSDDCLMQKNRLGAAIMFASQGLVFFQAGEEIARTKYGNCNSYNAPDGINQIDWSSKRKYQSLFNYYKGLIALRKEHPALRFSKAGDIQKHLSFIPTQPGLIAYTIDGSCVKDKQIAVIINGLNSVHEVTLPQKNWDVYVDAFSAGTKPIAKILSNKVSIPAMSAYILVKE